MVKQEDLIVGEKYDIKYSGQFCHWRAFKGNQDFSKEGIINVIFVGKISITGGERNIFYRPVGNEYLMFGTEKLDYIISEEQEILDSIKKLEDELKILKSKLNFK